MFMEYGHDFPICDNLFSKKKGKESGLLGTLFVVFFIAKHTPKVTTFQTRVCEIWQPLKRKGRKMRRRNDEEIEWPPSIFVWTVHTIRNYHIMLLFF